MDMSYATQFEGAYQGDAYERMFLNAALGDGSLFVSAPELVEAWRIFTPLLHEIDEQKPEPHLYPFGSTGPKGLAKFLKSHAKIVQQENWREFVALHAYDCKKLAELFEELDTDKSGSISCDELVHLAKRFYDGRTPTTAEVSKIMAMLSKDGSNTVSRQDFMRGAYKLNRAFGVPEDKRDHSEWGPCAICEVDEPKISDQCLLPTAAFRLGVPGSGTETCVIGDGSPSTVSPNEQRPLCGQASACVGRRPPGCTGVGSTSEHHNSFSRDFRTQVANFFSRQ